MHKYIGNKQCNKYTQFKLLDQNLLSDICKAEAGKTPATAALPKKVDWNLTPSSSLNAITWKVQE